MKDVEVTYVNLRKVAIGLCEDYTSEGLLDFLYFKEHKTQIQSFVKVCKGNENYLCLDL